MLWIIFFTFLGTAAPQTNFCHTHVSQACKFGGHSILTDCTSRNEELDRVEFDLQSFVNKHIVHSFQYLLLSSHFNNFEKNREGFRKLFKTLSDEAWKDSIYLIKYLTKRGGKMDFRSYWKNDIFKVHKSLRKEENYEVYELESLAKALDMQKSMAVEVNKIYLAASRDPELLSHIENVFAHRLASRIRELSGQTNDLKTLIASNKHNGLYLHLFDDYLAKIY